MEKFNDGQHRQRGGGYNDGQKTRNEPGTIVGQTRGGEQAMSVPKPAADADISTTVYVGGADEEKGEPSEKE